ncbi:hypothetical protein [Pokkaliibacter plantistimulans]|uniref:hypothetical protein n=1 Tax=Pokkaliibacter plantistimulans TaxID=1635171 RepID=UPI002D76E8F3|nr:hypothetical protein [Pokkaliibacter plantistimulans]
MELDVNKTLGRKSPFPSEMAIAVPDGVNPDKILDARAVDPDGKFTGPFIKNPVLDE